MAQSVQRPKMLWYYSRIIDWMIANPGRPMYECAAYIGKTPTTLSIIVNSDVFKAALAQRKAEFQQAHDFGLIEKTTKIAHASLDAILETLEKKRDKVPLGDLKDISDSALGRLGYGAKPVGPQPGVTVNVNASQQNVVVPVSHQDLAEARMALRAVQQDRQRQLSSPRPETEGIIDVDATEVEPEVKEVASASIASSN